MPFCVHVLNLIQIIRLQSRLSRFTGASAISSADFYGEEDDEGHGRRNNNNNFDIENMNASELMSQLSVKVRTSTAHPLSHT